MRNKRIGLSAVFAILISSVVFGQELKQQIRGKVTDAISGQALVGANVIVGTYSDPIAGAETDDLGKFIIESVALGRYDLFVSFTGYQSIKVPEVLISASRAQEIQISLYPSTEEMEGLVVISQMDPLTIEGIGTRIITPEQTLRFASTYFDVARLTTAYPGVSLYNDQGNNIISRGHSPNSIQWKLEGVEIVNPNHTSNAGTLSDTPTQSGGGVNILSTQMLSNAKFVNGGFTSDYGNGLSGYYDMFFRKGNTEKHDFVAQVSLLGIDLAAEGPLKKGTDNSYLVNYRYSFVGILSAMGIDFGGESIAFQDLAFNISFDGTKTGDWEIFGMGGASKNDFVTERDASLWEENKDQYDIFFKSKMGAIGFTNFARLGRKSALKTTGIFSGLENSRTSFLIDPDDYSGTMNSDDLNTKAVISVNSKISRKIGEKSFINAGIQYNHMNFDLYYTYLDNEGRTITPLNSKEQYDVIQPFVEWNSVEKFMEYTLGLRYYLHSLTNYAALEPRANLLFKTGSKNVVYGSFTRVHQVQLPGVYFTDIQNRELDPTRNDQVQLGMKNYLGKGLFTIEGYYHFLDNVPVDQDELSDFSVLNLVDGIVENQVVNNGKGTNAGLEISYDRKLENNWYYVLSGTIYDSKYTGSDNIWRNTRFNGRYGMNATGGREFHNLVNGIIGINAQFTYLGGLWDTPIDEDLSEQAGKTIYKQGQAFTSQLAAYKRFDLRVSWTKNKPNYTRMLSLDIQNVLSFQNDAYMMYDPFLMEVITATQLGIIPVLSYRMEF